MLKNRNCNCDYEITIIKNCILCRYYKYFERNEKEVIIEVKRYEEITTHKAFDYDSINWEEDEDE